MKSRREWTRQSFLLLKQFINIRRSGAMRVGWVRIGLGRIDCFVTDWWIILNWMIVIRWRALLLAWQLRWTVQWVRIGLIVWQTSWSRLVGFISHRLLIIYKSMHSMNIGRIRGDDLTARWFFAHLIVVVVIVRCLIRWWRCRGDGIVSRRWTARVGRRRVSTARMSTITGIDRARWNGSRRTGGTRNLSVRVVSTVHPLGTVRFVVRRLRWWFATFIGRSIVRITISSRTSRIVLLLGSIVVRLFVRTWRRVLNLFGIISTATTVVVVIATSALIAHIATSTETERMNEQLNTNWITWRDCNHYRRKNLFDSHECFSCYYFHRRHKVPLDVWRLNKRAVGEFPTEEGELRSLTRIIFVDIFCSFSCFDLRGFLFDFGAFDDGQFRQWNIPRRTNTWPIRKRLPKKPTCISFRRNPWWFWTFLDWYETYPRDQNQPIDEKKVIKSSLNRKKDDLLFHHHPIRDLPMFQDRYYQHHRNVPSDWSDHLLIDWVWDSRRVNLEFERGSIRAFDDERLELTFATACEIHVHSNDFDDVRCFDNSFV